MAEVHINLFLEFHVSIAFNFLGLTILELNFQVAEFNWDSRMKGFILSVFSIGYLFGPIGGALCLKLGAVTTYGISVGGTAVLTILTPLLIRTHLYSYIAARILEGVFEVNFNLLKHDS